jgi:NUC153 domain
VDPRFSSIANDPRFRLPSKRQTRVPLDSRFKSALKHKDFLKKSNVDRYGRRIESDEGEKALKRMYGDQSDGATEEDESEDEDKDGGVKIGDLDDDEEVVKELARLDSKEGVKFDPARGEGLVDTSEEETSSDEEEEEEEDEAFADESAQPVEPGVPMGEVTSRLAVVNLDWDNIRAVDLMATLQSFVPTSGRVESVTIYPSEFGKERMEREEMEGPPAEIFKAAKARGAKDDDTDEEVTAENLVKEDLGEEYDSGALRRYQLERLRYFYAVVTLNSEQTAKAIYDSCDGAEYQSSANFFDLRFIPDGVIFEDDKPRDECTKLPDDYRPNDFVTDALQHSKVRLTWDEEDTGRKEATRKAFGRKQQAEEDLKAYLASSSSEDEVELKEHTMAKEEVADPATGKKLSRKEIERNRLRSLLGLGNDVVKLKEKVSAPVGDMQVTFSSGLSSAKGPVFEEAEREETTVEKYRRKEKERKKARLANMKARRDGTTTEDVDTENTVEKVKETQDLGFDDPFFQDEALRTKDKSKSNRTKEERVARRERKATEAAEKAAKSAELELLMLDDEQFGESRLPSGVAGDSSKAKGHFDMKAIARAEKLEKKKGRKGKKLAAAIEEAGKAGGKQEGFEMPVQDPRFAAVYKSHEFAIDPSNSRFSGTEGMKKLLEEGRRKRKGGGEEGLNDESGAGRKRKKEELGDEKDELKKLVKRVKEKAARP